MNKFWPLLLLATPPVTLSLAATFSWSPNHSGHEWYLAGEAEPPPPTLSDEPIVVDVIVRWRRVAE